MDMNVRGVPDHVHAVLVRRASERGMSLRAYVVDVLSEHSALPTTDEWLEEVADLPPAHDTTSAAAAIVAERREREAELTHASRGR